jgi:N utilization substance protein A
MKLTFDTETIRMITLFENITHAPVKDCVIDKETNTIYFLIDEGKIGIAIGKNGSSVKHAEKAIGKTIKLFESSKDLVTFVKKIIPQATSIKVKNADGRVTIEIRVDKKNRPIVIGRNGRNLKLYRELLKRNHRVDNLTVK